SPKRTLPKWRSDAFHRSYSPSPAFEGEGRGGGSEHDVVFFADTLNNYFEPDNARAAVDVLAAGGYEVRIARPRDGGPPPCLGRTFPPPRAGAPAQQPAPPPPP